MDYTIVQADQFHNYSQFEVKTVLNILENFSIPSDSPMPDHSLVCWEYMYTDLLLNRLSQQICGAQPKSICHVKKYSRVPNKSLFKCDTLELSLKELITELDTITPSSNTDNIYLQLYHGRHHWFMGGMRCIYDKRRKRNDQYDACDTSHSNKLMHAQCKALGFMLEWEYTIAYYIYIIYMTYMCTVHVAECMNWESLLIYINMMHWHDYTYISLKLREVAHNGSYGF